MPIRPRGTSWQADVQAGGVRHRETFNTEAEAIRWEADVRASLRSGTPVPQRKAAASPLVSNTEPTLSSLCDDLETTAAPLGWKGRRSTDKLVLSARIVIRMLGEHTRASEVTTERVDALVLDLEAAGKAPATINRRLAALSKMLKYALRKRYIAALPGTARQTEGKGRLRFLTTTEERALLAHLLHHGASTAHDLTMFLLDTGCRLGEALGLTWRWLEDDKVVFIGGLVAGEATTKNGDTRTVPLTARLRGMVEKRTKAGEGLDKGDKVFAIAEQTYRQQVYRARDKAELGDDVVLHTFRHTCASRLVQRGVPLKHVQDWMGHKTISITARYGKLAPGDLTRFVSVLDAPIGDLQTGEIPYIKPAVTV